MTDLLCSHIFSFCLLRLAIAYCNLEFQAITEATPKSSYVFSIGGYCW